MFSDGAPDALILEWSGGPANATGWQYRINKVWPEQWQDIPGSDPDTRSYRLSDRDTGPYAWSEMTNWRKRSFLRVRPVMGPKTGEPSNWAVAHPITHDRGRPVLHWATPAEGDGHTRWLVVGRGRMVITIPDGMLLTGGAVIGEIDNPHAGGRVELQDEVSGSQLMVSKYSGEELARTIQGGEDECVGHLFDQLVASVRILEPAPLLE